MDELIRAMIEYELDIPFKEFTAGQVIQSKQFNDDMKDIQDKINEVITKYNVVVGDYINHINNRENPHQVTAHQTGAYTTDEVDTYVDDLRSGNFNDNSIVNRVLADDCIETRNIKNNSITTTKVDNNFGSQINISQNIDIINRYTKLETDEIIKSKVGDGTYTKEEIDNKLGQVQAGQIVDKSIGIEQLKSDVGQLIDVSQNKSILERYTKEEVDYLISQGALPRDWGNLTDSEEYGNVGELPIADVMVCGEAKASISTILDVDVKEIVNARGSCVNLSERLNLIESNFGSGGGVDYETIVKLETLESTLDVIVKTFSGVLGIDAQQLIQSRIAITSIADRLTLSESILDAIILMFSEVINNE